MENQFWIANNYWFWSQRRTCVGSRIECKLGDILFTSEDTFSLRTKSSQILYIFYKEKRLFFHCILRTIHSNPNKCTKTKPSCLGFVNLHELINLSLKLCGLVVVAYPIHCGQRKLTRHLNPFVLLSRPITSDLSPFQDASALQSFQPKCYESFQMWV